MVNGTCCGSPALRGETRCYYHHNWYLNRRREHESQPYALGRAAFVLPPLESLAGVQLAIEETTRCLLEKRMELKEAVAVFYGLQLASANLKRLQQPLPIRVVTSIQPDNAVAEQQEHAVPADSPEPAASSAVHGDTIQSDDDRIAHGDQPEDNISIQAVAAPVPSPRTPARNRDTEVRPSRAAALSTPPQFRNSPISSTLSDSPARFRGSIRSA